VTSTLLVFNVPKSDVILCVLAKYDDEDFLTCAESDTVYGGAACVMNAFKECFERHKVKNGIDAAGDDGVLESFESHAYRASNTLLSTSDWGLSSSNRVIWLGSLAWRGNWRNYPYKTGTLLAAAVSGIHLQESTMTADSQCTSKVPLLHHHYAKNLSILAPDSARVAASFVSQVAMPPTQYSFNTGIEDIAVVPSVVVAGFMKSASTFLFQALTQHPSVLPALKGSQYKETRCYSADPYQQPPRNLLARSWCFPFIEEHEPFVAIDGTVSYSVDERAAYTLQEVVFLL
jgi:hypothetical protein